MATMLKKKKSKSKVVLKYGDTQDNDKRKLKINAKHALTLTITDQHIAAAKCKDPAKCVIAQALRDTVVGDFFEGFAVGASCTKVYTSDKVIRYKTPYKLSVALKTFDVTKRWPLPPGDYTLLPYKGAQRRWESARRQGGKQDKFRGRISAPTRYAPSINTLAKAA